ncbi:hypothetical protein KKF82_08420 [Patescibacteria group bacterium]|nr:hypothetical protein [Patescibacteria group bacterium]
MPEKELTKNLTRVIKGADKLIRDVEKDTAQIIGALSSLKETLLDLKHIIQKPEDE